MCCDVSVRQKVVSNLFVVKLISDACSLVSTSSGSARSLLLRSQRVHVRTVYTYTHTDVHTHTHTHVHTQTTHSLTD